MRHGGPFGAEARAKPNTNLVRSGAANEKCLLFTRCWIAWLSYAKPPSEDLIVRYSERGPDGEMVTCEPRPFAAADGELFWDGSCSDPMWKALARAGFVWARSTQKPS